MPIPTAEKMQGPPLALAAKEPLTRRTATQQHVKVTEKVGTIAFLANEARLSGIEQSGRWRP